MINITNMSLYFVIVILICLVSGGVLYKTMGANKTSFLASLLIVVAGAFIMLSSEDDPQKSTCNASHDTFNARRDSQEPEQFERVEREEVNQIIDNLSHIDESKSESNMEPFDVHGKPLNTDFNPEAQTMQSQTQSNTKKAELIPQKVCDDEFDIDVYNGVGDIENIYRKMGTIGDNLICNRMKYMGMQPKLSKDIRSAYNKYTIQPLFEEELREQADKIWWENDQLDMFM